MFRKFFSKISFLVWFATRKKKQLKNVICILLKTLSANSLKNKLFVPTRMSTVSQVHLNVPWGFRKSRSKKKTYYFPLSNIRLLCSSLLDAQAIHLGVILFSHFHLSHPIDSQVMRIKPLKLCIKFMPLSPTCHFLS